MEAFYAPFFTLSRGRILLAVFAASLFLSFCASNCAASYERKWKMVSVESPTENLSFKVLVEAWGFRRFLLNLFHFYLISSDVRFV